MKHLGRISTLVIALAMAAAGLGTSVAGAGGVHRVGNHRIGVATAANGLAPRHTSVWVSTNHAWVETGTGVIFRAHVNPDEVNRTRLSGTLTWTIIGSDGSKVPCIATIPLQSSGKAACRVGSAQLLATNSPYAVVAIYSGDANFQPSTGSVSEGVFRAEVTLRIGVSASPVGGAATSFTVQVSSGQATPLVGGEVWFKVASSHSARGVAASCLGPKPIPGRYDGQPVVGGIATCNLPSGWLVVPPATAGDRHPRSKWLVTASSVDPSFGWNSRSMSGSTRS